jgi:hypothetical protein
VTMELSSVHIFLALVILLHLGALVRIPERKI